MPTALPIRPPRLLHLALVFVLSSSMVGWDAASAEDSAPVRIEIDSPSPGAVVQNDVHLAPIKGRAQGGSGEPDTFDVFLAIDVSHSTRYPSGIDIDEDGEVGFNPALELVVPGTYPEDLVSTDPDDVILAAEVHAARLLLEALDSQKTQIGVIVFSGDVNVKTGKRRRFDQHDAKLLVPLTSDFKLVDRALDEILQTGPNGATNFAAAVKLAVRELAGLSGAESSTRQGSKKIVLFLTDGVPTFPIGSGRSSDPGDTEAAINAARLAGKAGVTINTFALGRHALAAPIAAEQMARITSGAYTPVRNPGEIVSFLQGVSFANLEDVVIRNLTTQDVSFDVSLYPDGSFSGFVPVRSGKNKIRVTALASDGSEGSANLEFVFEKSRLTDNELSRELERVKNRNKELMLLLERKRIQKFRERQKKEILIEQAR